MLERFLKKTKFESFDDFMQHYEVCVPEHFNFAYDVVDAWAKRDADKRAMLWTNEHGEERTFTFGDMKRYSDRTASYLQSLGIRRGDVVMLILKRRYEWWWTMLALHKLGAIVVPATHLLRAHDIEYRCNAASIKAIVACGDEDVIHNVEAARPYCHTLKHCVSIGPSVPYGWLDFHEGLSKAMPYVRIAENDNTDTMLIYFTSGTTGHPKMVCHDFTYPLGHIITAACWHNLYEESLHLTISDTGWGKAAWGKLYGQWIVGATVFVYDYEGKFPPADILRTIEKHRITSFCAPPTVFRFLIKEDVEQYDISSLRYCTVAGEALNPSVFDRWKRLTGISLMEGYGQTETTLSIGTYPWCKPKPGSMGVCGPQYHVELMDHDGHILGHDQEGEIVIRTSGPKPLGLFKEYYRNEALTSEANHDGWYHTGDIAYRDRDGYYWYVGRMDDVIKSSGYRIGPFEVESALMKHPAVLECAITGVPDDIRGQLVKATIVLTDAYRDKADEALIKDIQHHAKEATAPYKYPRVIEFVDELPKTISGKIRHCEIRNRA
ncbi:MAG: AMP-binding protein [Bacteroidaceae bacterium]|nr:AMP-binding protein [Bacteroidaceae bacterium]